MARKDIIGMTQEELKRAHVIRKALEKVITQKEASKLIGVTLRQAQRLAYRVRQEGDGGVIHKGRGKASNRALSEKLKQKVLKLYKKNYADFGPTLASEKLLEREKIKVNDETLRLWLIENNVEYKRRKKRAHRQWRERKHYYGQMIQLDGSKHAWFEGRGPKCVFMGYIDDATGKPFGRFYEYEGTWPAMDSFKRYIKKNGIPVSVYLDKHTTYKSPAKQTIEDELKNREPLSQFERALKELGVDVIHAHSPQAKGRIERLFRTFQDRLLKELRLENVKTIEEANKVVGRFLSFYAKRFSIKPLKNENLHRPIPEKLDLDRILCVKTERTLKNDFTVSHDKKLYQILDNIPACKVVMEEKVKGSIEIYYKNRRLKYKEIIRRPKTKEAKTSKVLVKKKHRSPSSDHPWKQVKIIPQNNRRGASALAT
jgi:hypothetical protein